MTKPHARVRLDAFEPLVSPDENSDIRPPSALAGTAAHAAKIGSCLSGRRDDLPEVMHAAAAASVASG